MRRAAAGSDRPGKLLEVEWDRNYSADCAAPGAACERLDSTYPIVQSCYPIGYADRLADGYKLGPAMETPGIREPSGRARSSRARSRHQQRDDELRGRARRGATHERGVRPGEPRP